MAWQIISYGQHTWFMLLSRRAYSSRTSCSSGDTPGDVSLVRCSRVWRGKVVIVSLSSWSVGRGTSAMVEEKGWVRLWEARICFERVVVDTDAMRGECKHVQTLCTRNCRCRRIWSVEWLGVLGGCLLCSTMALLDALCGWNVVCV